MSHKYAFILGRNPALSYAEIISFFKRENIITETSGVSDEVTILKVEEEIDGKKTISELGGTIKIAKINSILELEDSDEQLFNLFSEENLFSHFFEKRKGKVHFGVSLYFLDPQSDFKPRYKKLLENINSIIKNNLRDAGQSAGFVRIKERSLSSVSVVKNELLKKGAEIILVFSKEKLFVGKTLAVQEFADYSNRDYGRPKRDSRSGMLPPKLAKIMLNLSRLDKNSIILDPFCGSGTIVTEAMLLGYQNIYGSDVSQKAVDSTSQNIDWLKNRYHGEIISPSLKIFQSEVSHISKYIDSHSLDSIITEPYLGPSFTRLPSDFEIKQVTKDLASLYKRSFEEFAKILKDKATVIIVFPVFKSYQGYIWIDIFNDLKSLGFHQTKLLSDDIAQKFPFYYSKRNTFIYGRGDEFIKREVVSLVFSP